MMFVKMRLFFYEIMIGKWVLMKNDIFVYCKFGFGMIINVKVSDVECGYGEDFCMQL